jgi:hypothetical protein
MSFFSARERAKGALVFDHREAWFSGETRLTTVGLDCLAKDLEKGAVLVSRRGAVQVEFVDRKVTDGESMVRIKADAFARSLPVADVIVASDTLMRVSGEVALAMDVPEGTIVAAGMAVNGETVVQEPFSMQTIVKIGFREPTLVMASGMSVLC